MVVEVLVAAMGQVDHSLLDRLNIGSDVIVGNQCDVNGVEDFLYRGHRARYLSFAERGVGLNRNNALMRATGDVCLLADDDMRYVDDYVGIVLKAFGDNPDADVIIFNLIEKDVSRYVIKKKFRVGGRNFMRFGAARIAFRRRSVTKQGISFNLHFGGGAEYGNGEDALFLADCLAKGLRVVAVPVYIAELTEERGSTWFRGYDVKYFMDKGALFACMSRRWAWFFSLQYCIRHRGKFRKEMSWLGAYGLMVRGISEFVG